MRAFLASGRQSAIVPVRVDINGVLQCVPVKLVLRRFRDDARLIEIYGRRWGIETAFREMKSIAAIEQWHSTTPVSPSGTPRPHVLVLYRRSPPKLKLAIRPRRPSIAGAPTPAGVVPSTASPPPSTPPTTTEHALNERVRSSISPTSHCFRPSPRCNGADRDGTTPESRSTPTLGDSRHEP